MPVGSLGSDFVFLEHCWPSEGSVSGGNFYTFKKYNVSDCILYSLLLLAVLS